MRLVSKAEHTEPYSGLFVAPWADNTAETWGQKPAERNLQEGDELPEKADRHQREQHAVWG